jgi:cytochrome c heme-lyase
MSPTPVPAPAPASTPAPAPASAGPAAEGVGPEGVGPEGCPVQHKGEARAGSGSGSGTGGCPVQHSAGASPDRGGCPVEEGARGGMMEALGIQAQALDPKPTPAPKASGGAQHNTPANDMAFGQDRYPGQRVSLSRHRATSTIPNDDFHPAHQPEGTNEWVYPSEQQYYNAMKRKGYSPGEEDVPVILAIHNTVNERGANAARISCYIILILCYYAIKLRYYTNTNIMLLC